MKFVFDSKIDILIISEVWLDDIITDSQVKVDDYTIEINDRNRHGGGVAIYIKHDLNYTLRDDLNKDIECLWLQCKLFSDFLMLLCCLYHPTSASIDNMLDMFDKAILENKDTVIMGYFNFNYTVDETLAITPVQYLEHLTH